MKNEIQTAPSQQVAGLAANDAQSMMRIIETSMTRPDFDIARLMQLLEVKERWEEAEARKAFVSDMAEFKKDPPRITKDKQVAFNGTSYMHATLGNVTSAIVEGLARNGFSHRWDTEQSGANIIVTCILTHKQGHSERTTLSATKDDSGKKNSIQQMASTVTYLQRYTLLSATGVATNDQEDDDGRGAELDTTLADKWIAQAKAATTADALAKVWAEGVIEINRAKDQNAYVEFKAIVTERGTGFTKAAPVAKTAEEMDFERSKA